MKIKFAVIGLYYASNLGDAVICDCVVGWLKRRYPGAQIDLIDIENKKGFPVQKTVSRITLEKRKWNLRRDYWLTKYGITDRIYYWNALDISQRRNFYKKVAEYGYSAVVFAGGQIFMDWLSLDVAGFLEEFEKMGTPVFFNACGTGMSVSGKIQRSLAKYLQSKVVCLISSRDNTQEIETKYLEGKKEVRATYDPALWTKETYSIKKENSKVVGLGVMYTERFSRHKLIRFWLDVIHTLDKRQIQWKIFCNGDIEDYEFGRCILNRLGMNTSEKIYRCAKAPRELVEQIASFGSIISFRLHSHIISASLGIPAVAIMWDEKLKFFYENIGCPERCRTINDSGEVIGEVLQNAIEEGYDDTRIGEQKQFSKRLLLDSIKQVIDYE